MGTPVKLRNPRTVETNLLDGGKGITYYWTAYQGETYVADISFNTARQQWRARVGDAEGQPSTVAVFGSSLPYVLGRLLEPRVPVTPEMPCGTKVYEVASGSLMRVARGAAPAGCVYVQYDTPGLGAKVLPGDMLVLA